MKQKQGISLIVLVITIIVMIVLAGAIILTLNNSGIIEKATDAVEQSNLATLKELTQMAWAEAYAGGERTEEGLKAAVDKVLEDNKVDTTKYKITVTKSGVIVGLKTQIPETWQANVVDIVDTVPIPKGFVASSATGENTKNGGLVIYEGTEAVTDANVENAKRERNQYVWVPVEDFSRFVRQRFGSGSFSNSPGSGTWEIVLDEATNMPLATQETDVGIGITSETLAEAIAMYESVKEYKGFYIARYEMGLDVGSHRTQDDQAIIYNVHSKMNKAPYNYADYGENSLYDETTHAVAISRNIYQQNNNNYGVISTPTYAVQWDTTLAWWRDGKAQNGTKQVTIEDDADLNNSLLYGNYYDSALPLSSFNEGAQYATDPYATYSKVLANKPESTAWLLTTGASEMTRINNIYDMAGNVRELTMEAEIAFDPITRGGDFKDTYGNGSVADRYFYVPELEGYYLMGFRTSLYIKK